MYTLTAGRGPSIVTSAYLHAANRVVQRGLEHRASLSRLPTCVFIHRHYILCSEASLIEDSGGCSSLPSRGLYNLAEHGFPRRLPLGLSVNRAPSYLC
jgi:hypothetical protein